MVKYMQSVVGFKEEKTPGFTFFCYKNMCITTLTLNIQTHMWKDLQQSMIKTLSIAKAEQWQADVCRVLWNVSTIAGGSDAVSETLRSPFLAPTHCTLVLKGNCEMQRDNVICSILYIRSIAQSRSSCRHHFVAG